MDANAYLWPREDLRDHRAWRLEPSGQFRVRTMPETAAELENDSRWPAFFPAPMCLVTTTDGKQTALEKVVGASIVNRFPYVMALSFCRHDLSGRHHRRSHFMATLESGGTAAIQFLPPARGLQEAMRVITTSNDSVTAQRLGAVDLPFLPAHTNGCPVFDESYLVYEARLVRSSRDFHGQPIFDQPWLDVGSHRLYFLEINAIQLRADIAVGQTQIQWRSLPTWQSSDASVKSAQLRSSVSAGLAYQKGFTADYAFPSAQTVAFEADQFQNGRAIKLLPPLATDQVEVDNDRARWPCFFPSSVGMITSMASGEPSANLMPCGSTTVVSRHPMVIACAVSYAAINERYAPRASLTMIRQAGRFGCGVPVLTNQVLGAIRYAGNVSFSRDTQKIVNAGLSVDSTAVTPRLTELPIHYDCELVGEIRLGTHFLLLGEVKRISVRAEVTPDNALRWAPWANLAATQVKEKCA